MGMFDKYFRKFQNGTCGENVSWHSAGKTLTINGAGAMENYYYYGDDDDDNVNSPWWNYREAIKKIIICDGVTSIGEYSFCNCNNLIEIKIPDSVILIGKWAFTDCWRLKEIQIPNGVTSINKDTFSDCYSLVVIRIPDNITSIGDCAFMECTNLTKIQIPDSVTLIGECTFCDCESLTEIQIPDKVTSIGAVAFSWCENLMSIKIPDSVISIGEGAFYECKNLKEIHYPEGRGFEKNLSEGNNAKLIPYKSLRWKVDGKTLKVGGVRVIKDFSPEEPPWVDSVSDIQKIIIEEGVEKISANAFIDCKRLELLTIPASVKTIGDMAFTACFCGNRLENGGKNVFWCLEDGVLILKKNPAAKNEADFSTGSVSWFAVEKNITGFKLESGVVPKEKFFAWLAKRGNAMQISFT